MERLRVAPFLLFPVLLPAIFVSGQSSNPVPSQNGPPAPVSNSQSSESQTQTSQTPPSQTPAPPIPDNAPRISKQTRLEVIRVFETQIVYARTFFPMGAKGIKLKDGVTTPHGPELQQALALWGPAVRPGDPAHISYVEF